MEFTEKDLEHLERLSRIRLSEESREVLRGQLARIIDFVRELQAIDTSGFEAASLDWEIFVPLRDDKSLACLDRESVLREAPDRRGDFFGVPPIIEGED